MESLDTSINTFKRHFTSVKPTLYQLVIPIPTDNKFIENKWVTTDKAGFIYLFCKGAKLPSSRVDERVSSYFGRNYYEAGDRTFELLELTFYNTQDFGIRNWIESWMQKVNQRMENTQPNEVKETYDYYLPSIELHQLNRRNEIIKSYLFYYLFPVECSEIPLEYAATNSIEEFTVQFRYQYWEEETKSAKQFQDTFTPDRRPNSIFMSNSQSDVLNTPNQTTERTTLNTKVPIVKNDQNPLDGLDITINSDYIGITIFFNPLALGNSSDSFKKPFKIYLVNNTKLTAFQESNPDSFTISREQLFSMISATSQQKLAGVDFNKFTILIDGLT